MADVRGIDTDPLVRFLTGDDLDKQARMRALLDRTKAGDLILVGPVTVIADAVYVLTSPRLYGMARADVADMLAALLAIPGFRLRDRRTVVRALQIYAETRLDFGDTMLLASLELGGQTEFYSHDHGFDRVAGPRRIEP